MRDDTPTVYLLAGTSTDAARTYARMLEAQGVVRLFDGAGAGADLGPMLAEHVLAGRDVVVDEGLDDPDARAYYQRLVEEHGGQWCVMHMSSDHASALRRLSEPGPAG